MMRVARVAVCLFALCGGAPALRAEEPPPPPPADSAPAEKKLEAGELEQLVAPIALYPDPLIAQVLMASTYPLEIVQAARWVEKPENTKLKGDALDKALAAQSWDDSVKSLVPFPTVLKNMNDKLDWTQKLGDAFLEQQKEVMDAIQRLRAKARAAGNLESNDKQIVTVEEAPPPPAEGEAAQQPASTTTTQTIVIQPANPQVVYVPTYQPTVVYGTWAYPSYPPYYMPAPPGAYFAAGMFWGAAIGVSAAYWGGAHCGWNSGDIDINNNVDINGGDRNTNIDRGDRGDRGQGNRGDRGQGNRGDRGQGGGKWKHDPSHRKGVSYKDAKTAQKFDKGAKGNAAARDNYRGRSQGGDLGGRGSSGVGDRGAGGAANKGPGNAGVADRGGSKPGGAGGAGGAGNRDLGSSSRGGASTRDAGAGSRGGSGSGGGAFDRSGGGSSARASSARGSSSMGSRGGGGGGSRGGGGRGGGGRGGGRR
jgi:hypothetical protein